MPDIVYFNNCKRRPHEAIFGPQAFFDLGVSGRQATQANNLPIGQRCVVASYDNDGNTVFDWHSLSSETVLPDNENEQCRVFFGPLTATETLTKASAAKKTQYLPFFNVNGDFKRPSVLSAAIPARSVPTNAKRTNAGSPDEESDSESYIEGATRSILVNACERNAKARTACISIYGTACVICGFDFGAVYGPDADGYIHVHHLKPLAKLRKTYRVDPKVDLRPVCPNCHAVIHLGNALRSIDEVKAMLKSKRKTK
ncbi:MAG: hypothetical protein R3C59_15325 [Planctomycetaceae bacterium]